jgi:hypothetical protein
MKYFKVTSTIFLVILFSNFLNAQTSSVQGTVKDRRGVIPSAKVIIQNTEFKTICDFDGKFYFKGMNTGAYTLSIDLTGYTIFEKSFSLGKDENLNLGDLVLKEIQELNEVTVTTYAKTSENKALYLVKNSPTVVTVVIPIPLTELGFPAFMEVPPVPPAPIVTV